MRPEVGGGDLRGLWLVGHEAWGPVGHEAWGPVGHEAWGPVGPEAWGPVGLEAWGPVGLEAWGPVGYEAWGSVGAQYNPVCPINDQCKQTAAVNMPDALRASIKN